MRTRMNYDFIVTCKYNKEVDCIKKDKCLTCGWNPEVAKERERDRRAKYECKEQKKAVT